MTLWIEHIYCECNLTWAIRSVHIFEMATRKTNLTLSILTIINNVERTLNSIWYKYKSYGKQAVSIRSTTMQTHTKIRCAGSQIDDVEIKIRIRSSSWLNICRQMICRGKKMFPRTYVSVIIPESKYYILFYIYNIVK